MFFLFILVNILELQKQPKEINRELKNAREELEIANNVEEQIEGDKFTESIEVELFIRKPKQKIY
jgi:hypothetical protein